ncbi:MAG: nuclear transport factor 2 family protein [Acidobacteriia bacterium]|nr:nuclear transport factor 2 family protein [Terriglobia bacterium]
MARSNKQQTPAPDMIRLSGNCIRRFVVHALAIIVVFGAAFAALTGRSLAAADDEQVVIQADHALTEALGKADKTAVGALLDANFEWTDAEGKTRTKAGALQDVTALAADTEGETNVRTHNYGQLGRVAGTHHNENFVRLWVKRPEGWRAFLMLEAPVPTKAPHPAPPKAADKDCDNPCKSLPYNPTTAAERAAVATWLKLKMDEWHAIPDDWKNYVDESMVIFSPSMSMNKAERLALLTKQKETYGTGSPSAPVVSMRMFVFGNAVVMTAHHGPNAAGEPSYAVRIFTNEDGNWKIVLSAQTDVKQPSSAMN